MRKLIWLLSTAAALCGALFVAGCPRLLGAEEHKRKESMAKHTMMAEIYWASGNYEGAVDEYRAIIELAPRFPDAYQGLGNSLNKLGRYAEAAEAYRAAVGLDPENYDFRFNLGVTLARMEKYNEASAAFEKAAALRPDAAETYVYWGSALRGAQDYDGAAAALARALVIDPHNTLARVNLALTLEYRDPLRAKEEWKKVLAEPEVPEEYASMAREHLARLDAPPAVH